MLDSDVQQPLAAAGVADFRVAVHPHRGQVIVAPSGEIDLATVDQVERELAHLRQVGFDDIIVDLRSVTFIDSSGLQLLLTQTRAAQDDGYRFRIVGGSDETRRLFELTGTREAFEFIDRPRP